MEAMRRSIVALGIAVALSSATASADHDWNGYHWSQPGGTRTLTVRDAVSGAWDAMLTDALRDWGGDQALPDGSAIPNLFDFSVLTGKVSANVEVIARKYGNNGWLGLATIWLDASGHIARGRVQLNEWYFQLPSYNTAAVRQHVLCQEVGHVLGLDHNRAGAVGGSPDDTCMDDRTAFPSVAYPHPNGHDAEELASLYGHADAAASSATAQAGADGRRGIVVHVVPA